MFRFVCTDTRQRERGKERTTALSHYLCEAGRQVAGTICDIHRVVCSVGNRLHSRPKPLTYLDKWKDRIAGKRFHSMHACNAGRTCYVRTTYGCHG